MTNKQYICFLQKQFTSVENDPFSKMIFLSEAKAKKLAKDPQLRPYLRRVSFIITPYL